MLLSPSPYSAPLHCGNGFLEKQAGIHQPATFNVHLNWILWSSRPCATTGACGETAPGGSWPQGQHPRCEQPRQLMLSLPLACLGEDTSSYGDQLSDQDFLSGYSWPRVQEPSWRLKLEAYGQRSSEQSLSHACRAFPSSSAI